MTHLIGILIMAATLTANIMVIGKIISLFIPKKTMKTFVLRADPLMGITSYISELTTQEKSTVLPDAVDSVELVQKALADVAKANEVYLKESARVQDLKNTIIEDFKSRFQEFQKTKTPEELTALRASETPIAQAKIDEIQKTSEAKPEELVTVVLSDDKHAVLKKLIRMSVNKWQNADLFVEAARALDEAKEA